MLLHFNFGSYRDQTHAHQDACTSSSEEEEEGGEGEGEEKGEGERLGAAMSSASTNPYKAEPYKSKEPDGDCVEGSGGVAAAEKAGATATTKKKKPRPPTSYRRLWHAATGGDTKGALVG